ncbi:MAG: RagB/SusD family nutrient uptake outer membrane protein, partial [Tannerella sp.]|nr:RagB/SusD family nutrient uptake outer membrane protein [Tannerella sp.]
MKHMKYFSLKINILMAAMVFLANGCDTFVEPKYEPEFPWQNIDQLEMAVALPYTAFTGGAWGEPIGIYTEYEVLATDFGTPITDAAPNNEWPQWVGRTHRQVGIEALGWTQGVYRNLFGSIAGCNEALEFLNSGDPKELFPNDPESKLTEIPRAKAELYFWRGFAYYWAALYFTPPYDPQGDNGERVLPLKKTNLNANNTYIGTTKELWEFIIEDLREAKQLMPKTFHIPGRVDYYTICGALARAYFYTGQFAEAEAECTEIINSDKYALSNDVMEVWQVQQVGGLPDSEPKEIIWMYTTNSQGQYIEVFTVFSRAFPYDWGEVPVEYGRGKGSEGMWIGCRLSDAMVKKLG